MLICVHRKASYLDLLTGGYLCPSEQCTDSQEQLVKIDRLYHIYVLDALDAFNKRLVKRIEVKGFEVKNFRGTDSYLYLEQIVVSPKKPPMARLELEIGYNKSGSIRQRKDGSWEARVTVGRDEETGKQIQKSLYAGTKDEVSRKLRELAAEIDNGTYVLPKQITVGEWLDIWVE